jgi:hypothetical protein
VSRQARLLARDDTVRLTEVSSSDLAASGSSRMVLESEEEALSAGVTTQLEPAVGPGDEAVEDSSGLSETIS